MLVKKLLCVILYLINFKVSSASTRGAFARAPTRALTGKEHEHHFQIHPEEQLLSTVPVAQIAELEESLNFLFQKVSNALRKLLLGPNCAFKFKKSQNNEDYSRQVQSSKIESETNLLDSETNYLIRTLSSDLAAKIFTARSLSTVTGRYTGQWMGDFGPIILKDIGTGFLKLMALNLLWYFSPSTFSFITSFSLSSMLGIGR